VIKLSRFSALYGRYYVGSEMRDREEDTVGGPLLPAPRML